MDADPVMLGNQALHSSHASPFVILKWCIYFFVPAFLWAGVNFQTLREYFDASAELEQNQSEVARLEKEYAGLRQERKLLDLGGFPAEKAIRERFKMVLPGEGVIFIEDEAAKTEGSGTLRWSDAGTTRSAVLRAIEPAESELPQ